MLSRMWISLFTMFPLLLNSVDVRSFTMTRARKLTARRMAPAASVSLRDIRV